MAWEVRFRRLIRVRSVLTLKISVVAADDAGTERERKELDERFTQMRPEVLETLRECFLTFRACMTHMTQ